MDRPNSEREVHHHHQFKLESVQTLTTQTGTDQSLSTIISSREKHKHKNNSAADEMFEKTELSPIYESSNSPSNTINVDSPSSINFSQETSSSTFDSGYQSDHSSSLTLVKSIGHGVGLGHCDIITKLAEVEPNLVRTIIQYVGYSNLEHLISFSEVSTEWHTILETTSPKEAAEVYRYRKETHQSKLMHKENNLKGKPDKRCLTDSESPLTIVQEIGKPQSSSTPKPTKPKSTTGLHQKYYQAGQQLYTDESLTKCARSGCAFPAKHLLHNQKGQCTSNHCQFEFCTNCRCEFHGVEPCKVFKGKSSSHGLKLGGGVCTKRSKNNLHRLGKL